MYSYSGIGPTKRTLSESTVARFHQVYYFSSFGLAATISFKKRNGNISYRSFAAMLSNGQNQYNWTCGHRFNVGSWRHIYTDIISFQS